MALRTKRRYRGRVRANIRTIKTQVNQLIENDEDYEARNGVHLIDEAPLLALNNLVFAMQTMLDERINVP